MITKTTKEETKKVKSNKKTKNVKENKNSKKLERSRNVSYVQNTDTENEKLDADKNIDSDAPPSLPPNHNTLNSFGNCW